MKYSLLWPNSTKSRMKTLLFLLFVPAALLGSVNINVRDYGAYGDGVHDDTAAIQNAIFQVLPGSSGDGIYFPAGTYLCDQKIGINYQTPFRIFVLPNANFEMYGDSWQTSVIETQEPATLFDGYPKQRCQTSQTMTVQNISFRYIGGPTTASKAFAFMLSGKSVSFSLVQFVNWTNALYFPPSQANPCASLTCLNCSFQTSYGVPLIADDDLTWCAPTTAILGGGLTTNLTNCYFNGQDIYSTQAQGMDGIIKTLNQTTSIAITGCTVLNNREEAIAIDASTVPTEISISGNTLGPPAPNPAGHWCAGLSLYGCRGNAIDNTIAHQVVPIVVAGGNSVTSPNSIEP
jgi:hypothetical protein